MNFSLKSMYSYYSIKGKVVLAEKKYKQAYNFGLEKLKGKIYREPRRKLHFANTPEQRFLAKKFDTV